MNGHIGTDHKHQICNRIVVYIEFELINNSVFAEVSDAQIRATGFNKVCVNLYAVMDGLKWNWSDQTVVKLARHCIHAFFFHYKTWLVRQIRYRQIQSTHTPIECTCLSTLDSQVIKTIDKSGNS